MPGDRIRATSSVHGVGAAALDEEDIIARAAHETVRPAISLHPIVADASDGVLDAVAIGALQDELKMSIVVGEPKKGTRAFSRHPASPQVIYILMPRHARVAPG